MWLKRLSQLALVVSLLALSGCQLTPDVKQLNNKNKQLQQQLATAQSQVGQLQRRERELQTDVEELNRVIRVLGTEKSSRVQESSVLRGQVRKFVQHQIDGFKDFLVDGNLLDYIGGELVERSRVETKALTLIDLANPIPARGTLTGVGAHFTQPTQILVKVLRPIEDRYVLIWQSEPLQAKRAGVNRLTLPVSVGVEAGDVMAYQFPESTAVSFDTGTGRTLYSSQPLKLGSIVRESALSGARDRRAYSIGVFGLLH